MIISVASGKGGTGKTTVATNLAVSIEEDVQILDCDVDAPNTHLFLNPQIKEFRKVYADVPVIDESRCSFCRKCMDICRFNAIAVMGKKTVLTFPELCHSCGGCMAVCPEDAISETPRTIGTIELGQSGNLDFIHGKLDIGQTMSPPIIKEVRNIADSRMTTIIDAPPGTSCPVIAAMNGVDFVLLVTEPTPFGLHDLSLAVEAVKLLDIPCGIVINRSGMGDDSISEYAKKTNVPVLMEIPFDKNIARTYAKGELIVQALPEYRSKFLELFEQIKMLHTQKEGVR